MKSAGLLLLVGLLALGTLLPITPASAHGKPGACPKPGIGVCVEECSGDDTCKGNWKCCRNGCGHSCMAPVA